MHTWRSEELEIVDFDWQRREKSYDKIQIDWMNFLQYFCNRQGIVRP